MGTVETALESLKETLGLPRLAFDDNGQAAILVENAIHIDIVRQSDTELELSTVLSDLAGNLSPARAFALLKANYLGHYTGAARVALDPRDGEPILCQRVDVEALDAAGLEAALAGFVAYVGYWLGEGVARILEIEDGDERPGSIDLPIGSSDALVMRL